MEFDSMTNQGTTSPSKLPKTWPWIVSIVAAFVTGAAGALGIMSAVGDEEKAAPTPERLFEGTSSPVEPAVEEEPPPTLTAEDFTIELKILSKRCFGSAGCNLTYTIDPVYLGAESLDDVSATVTYEVLGGDSGPQINSFTLDSDVITYQEKEFISTPSSSTELEVEVTDVF